MRKWVYILLITFLSPCLFAQQIIASGGNYNENSDYSISWTMGESVIETFESDHHFLTQGFHQSILDITSLVDVAVENLQINVYPNPTSDKVILRILNEDSHALKLKLCNIFGRCLVSQNQIHDKSEIGLASFDSGIYLLEVFTSNGQLIQSVRIVKK